MRAYEKYKDSGVDWIGRVPEGWHSTKIKYSGIISSGDGIRNNDIKENGLYEVYGGNGFLGFSDEFNVNGESIIIGRVGALCGNIHISRKKRFISDNALIYTCKGNCNLDFIAFCMSAFDLNRLNESNAQPLITATKVLNTIIPMPTFPEQRAIAAYLDRKTAQIDGMIAKRERQIELLEEMKTAIISQAVTKGLDPKVKMKDSGVEWIGRVPKGWEMHRLKQILS
jgi:type I restriction enzyme S subunit